MSQQPTKPTSPPLPSLGHKSWAAGVVCLSLLVPVRTIAAERLHDWTGHDYAMSDEYNRDDDIDSVMRTVLAEYPADDETPMTELWWCDMNGGGRFMFSSDDCLMLFLAVDGMIELCVSDGGLREISRDMPHIKTRGDVRRLLKALGVEFNS